MTLKLIDPFPPTRKRLPSQRMHAANQEADEAVVAALASGNNQPKPSRTPPAATPARHRAIRKPAETQLSRHEVRCIAITVLVLAAMSLTGWITFRLTATATVTTGDPAEDARRVRLADLDRWGPPGPAIDGLAYVKGHELYMGTCAACHGADARGVKGMGKDLINSFFVLKNSDRQLAEFIKAGRDISDRANTTKMPMPPNGGNEDLTDADRQHIVAYLGGVRDPRRVPAVLPELPPEEPAVAAKTEAPAQAVPAPVDAKSQASAPTQVAAAELGLNRDGTITVATSAEITNHLALDPAVVARGKKVFSSCVACHAKDGKGVKGAGKDLLHSQFVATSSDAQLLDFIKKGRAVNDPANTTGIQMPPKGGNPALNDAKINDVIVYLRSLQQQAH
jgi:disulfide bond formation protein DsbB